MSSSQNLRTGGLVVLLTFSLCRSTAEALTNQNEAELQRRLAERQQDVGPTQEVLETRVQLLEEVRPPDGLYGSDPISRVLTGSVPQEAQLAQDQAQRMASLADSASQRCLVLEQDLVERMEETGGPPDEDRSWTLVQISAHKKSETPPS